MLRNHPNILAYFLTEICCYFEPTAFPQEICHPWTPSLKIVQFQKGNFARNTFLMLLLIFLNQKPLLRKSSEIHFYYFLFKHKQFFIDLQKYSCMFFNIILSSSIFQFLNSLINVFVHYMPIKGFFSFQRKNLTLFKGTCSLLTELKRPENRNVLNSKCIFRLGIWHLPANN